MKDLYNFTAWQWSKWKPWQKVYVVAMTSVIVGFLLPGIIGALLLVLGLTSLLSWFLNGPYGIVFPHLTRNIKENNKMKRQAKEFFRISKRLL